MIGDKLAGGNKVDPGLKFLHQAFGLESLHFGLFTDSTPPTMDTMRDAQKEYTKTLVGLVPKSAKTILDVGCGVGGTTKALVAAGFAAEGLSPDPYHKEQFPVTCGPDVPFHHSTFEPFSPGKTYDCLLFSESPQYIDKDAFFPKCVEITEPGSSLVVSDFFAIAPSEAYPRSFLRDDFEARAKRAGYEIASFRDITPEVLPNFEIMSKFLGYGQRFFEMIQEMAERRFLGRIARFFLRKRIRRVRETLYGRLPDQFDMERFSGTMSYCMYRLDRKS
jgi:SAM-dependent methyltransferase